jgi:hypothetical protein
VVRRRPVQSSRDICVWDVTLRWLLSCQTPAFAANGKLSHDRRYVLQSECMRCKHLVKMQRLPDLAGVVSSQRACEVVRLGHKAPVLRGGLLLPVAVLP